MEAFPEFMVEEVAVKVLPVIGDDGRKLLQLQAGTDGGSVVDAVLHAVLIIVQGDADGDLAGRPRQPQVCSTSQEPL